tara:strand:- start:758 stop:2422 length:1665 start_codon:yes stop_codon:yes gene_type:complete
MAKIKGSAIVAKALKNEGVDIFFYLRGGPIGGIINDCHALGLKGVNTRHEQASAMEAHAYSRVTGRPGVCMTTAGPGATNAVTGVANALVDCCPVITLGGSSAMALFGKGGWQELDQLAVFKTVTKWADRAIETRRIPEVISDAFRHAVSGKPGPTYVDLPVDVIEGEVEESEVVYPVRSRTTARPPGDPNLIKEAAEMLVKAERPIVLAGTGTFWSQSGTEFQEFVEKTNIPFFTTPQTRGIVPDDHEMCLLGARSLAFREADVVLVMGTRFNYMLAFGQAPRFNGDAKVIQVDIDSAEIGHNRAVDVGIVGDAKMVFQQLTEAIGDRRKGASAAWLDKLRAQDNANKERQEAQMESDAVPIHPLRLCKEVRDFMDRDAILTVDGTEILNFGRQSIPSFNPGSRLNSGPWGNVGTGIPFAIAAKAAHPDKQVLALTGDVSFGFNGLELEPAARQGINIITIVSNNAGIGARAPEQREVNYGQYMGFRDYQKIAEAFGGYGERVEKPEDIRPALERAAASGVPAVINVIVESDVKVVTQAWSAYRAADMGVKRD